MPGHRARDRGDLLVPLRCLILRRGRAARLPAPLGKHVGGGLGINPIGLREQAVRLVLVASRLGGNRPLGEIPRGGVASRDPIALMPTALMQRFVHRDSPLSPGHKSAFVPQVAAHRGARCVFVKKMLDVPVIVYQHSVLAETRAVGGDVAEELGWFARRRGRTVLLTVPLCAVLGACASGGRVPELARQTLAERATAFDHVAEVAGQEGDGAVAERLYRRAIADRPEWVEPQIGLGHLLLRRGDIEGARAAFGRAAQLAPGNGRPVAGLAEVDLAEHHPDVALQGFGRALRLTPGDAAALNGSGIALDQLGRHEEAQARYREALGHDPDDRAAKNNLGLSLALSGHAQEAVQVLSALAQAPAAVPRNRQNLALALVLLGRDQDAVATASLDEAPALAKADVALLDVLRRGVEPSAATPPFTPAFTQEPARPPQAPSS